MRSCTTCELLLRCLGREQILATHCGCLVSCPGRLLLFRDIHHPITAYHLNSITTSAVIHFFSRWLRSRKGVLVSSCLISIRSSLNHPIPTGLHTNICSSTSSSPFHHDHHQTTCTMIPLDGKNETKQAKAVASKPRHRSEEHDQG